jgi:hypothetical protein
MTSLTASGWEIMMTCEPSISVILAPARWAMDRTTSAPAALSAAPTAARDGWSFQAGCPVSSTNALAAMGRWERPRTSDSSCGRSAACVGECAVDEHDGGTLLEIGVGHLISPRCDAAAPLGDLVEKKSACKGDADDIA